MERYVWLFPVIFMFHEMEEIIGFHLWLNGNMGMLKEKYPTIAKEYEHHSTEGFALAVFEEYLLCIAISILSVVTGWYGLWLGGLVAFALHLAVHIGQSVVIRKYIPAVATSVIVLPLSVALIWKSAALLQYPVPQAILYSVVGVAVIGGNLKLIHIGMKQFTLKVLERR
ncbi:MAG: HXXEE domain-containing protein [Oscillospiraceae bacterium]|nr:HXXEE domain-containing protein [Oscillospiraceae bacterium]